MSEDSLVAMLDSLANYCGRRVGLTDLHLPSFSQVLAGVWGLVLILTMAAFWWQTSEFEKERLQARLSPPLSASLIRTAKLAAEAGDEELVKLLAVKIEQAYGSPLSPGLELALFPRDHWEAELKLTEKVLEKQPTYVYGLMYKAWLLATLKRDEEAAAVLMEAERLDPNSLEVETAIEGLRLEIQGV